MISIVITTYGDPAWQELSWSRAYPSALDQGVQEIIVHHEPDLTIGPARNNAAAQATGDWLLFLDADDELDPNYTTYMRNAINNPGRPEPALLQPSVSYVRKGHKGPVTLMPEKSLSTDNYLVIGTLLRRDLFNQIGGFNDYPHGFEDWSLWAKAWKAGATVYPVPKAIYYAHINPQSKHRTMWRDRRQQVATHLRVQAELFPELA